MSNIMDFIEATGNVELPNRTGVTPLYPNIASAKPPTSFGPPAPAAPAQVMANQQVVHTISRQPTGRFGMQVEDSGRPVGQIASVIPIAAIPVILPPASPANSVATNPEEAALEASIFGSTQAAPAPAPTQVQAFQQQQHPQPTQPQSVQQRALPTLESLFQPEASPVVTMPIASGGDPDFDALFGSGEDMSNFIPPDDEEEGIDHQVAPAAPVSQQPPQPQLVQQQQPVPVKVFAPEVAAAQPTSDVPMPPPLPEATKGLFERLDGEGDLGDSATVLKQFEQDLAGLRYHIGIAILHDPRNYHPSHGNPTHAALWNVKWNTQALMRESPHKLCEYENQLTAHQAWVRGLENEWTARYRLIGNELDRCSYKKRDQYPGQKVADKELKMFSGEKPMRTLRLEYMRAWGMFSLLEGMGDTFKQLEDGIKRTINLVSDDYRRTHYQK